MTIEELNELPVGSAAAAFERCCGSERWVKRMIAERPFQSEAHLIDAADQNWIALGPDDWLEAFAAHPRIGAGGSDMPSGSETAAGSSAPDGAKATGLDPWAAQEQSGVQSADARVRQRIAEANREYEEQFGYIFIVCATGKSAAEMLTLLEQRLHNAPDRELTIAAEEQNRITRIRIQKLLHD